MDTDPLNKLIGTLNSTGLEMVKYNLRGFKYQNHEVPDVREWINKKEQELKNIELQNIRKNASQNKIYKEFKHVNFIIQQTITKNLPYIIKTVITAVIVAFVILGIRYFFHIDLKP
ncbi:MAG: hypothetical protein ABSC54_10670 [Smithellaceae bacterium]|jgi:hypothetical protein